MEVTVWKHTAACNVSPIVNRFTICDHQVRTERNEFIQIQHRTVFLPNEPMELKRSPAVAGRPDDLATYVHRVNHTASIITDGAKIGDRTLSPKKCVELFIVCGSGPTCYLAAIDELRREAERTTQRS
jgi:hypothetical protein